MPVVKVTGLAELRRALIAISKDAPKELNKANVQIGRLVATEAKRLAPKGKHEGGGSVVSIASSIGVTQSPSLNTVSIEAGGKLTPHAAANEFGGYIARRGFKGINRRGKAEAHKRGHAGVLTHVRKRPYLFPAVAHKLNVVVAEYTKAIDALIARNGG